MQPSEMTGSIATAVLDKAAYLRVQRQGVAIDILIGHCLAQWKSNENALSDMLQNFGPTMKRKLKQGKFLHFDGRIEV
jgi:hypothetical protein